MFSRVTAKTKALIPYVMDKMRASLSYKHTRSGLPFPEHALVVYMNINPSCTVKATSLYLREMLGYLDVVRSNCLRHGVVKEQQYRPFKDCNRELMNCIQKSKSDTGSFLDLDADILHGSALYVDIVKTLEECIGSFHTIKTKVGYHFLLPKDHGCKYLHNTVQNFNRRASELCGGEVKFNSNGMVPVPGTLQGGELVKLL